MNLFSPCQLKSKLLTGLLEALSFLLASPSNSQTGLDVCSCQIFSSEAKNLTGKVFLRTTSERRWNAGETWVEFWVLTLFLRHPFWTARWGNGIVYSARFHKRVHILGLNSYKILMLLLILLGNFFHFSSTLYQIERRMADSPRSNSLELPCPA